MYLSSMLGIGAPSDGSPDIGVGVDGMGRLYDRIRGIEDESGVYG